MFKIWSSSEDFQSAPFKVMAYVFTHFTLHLILQGKEEAQGRVGTGWNTEGHQGETQSPLSGFQSAPSPHE